MNIGLNTTIASISQQRSEYGRQEFAGQRQGSAHKLASNDKVTITPEFLTGDDNVVSLGRLVLGGEEKLKAWGDKGLEITENSIRNAFDSFNQALK